MLSAHMNHSKPHVIFTLVDDWGSADAAYRELAIRPGSLPQPLTGLRHRE